MSNEEMEQAVGQMLGQQMEEQRRVEEEFRKRQEESAAQVNQKRDEILKGFMQAQNQNKLPPLSEEGMYVLRYMHANPRAVPVIARFCQDLDSRLAAAIEAVFTSVGSPPPNA